MSLIVTHWFACHFHASSPGFSMCRFIPLVRDADVWQKIHHDEPAADSTLPGGTLKTYSKRGWCKFLWPIRRV